MPYHRTERAPIAQILRALGDLEEVRAAASSIQVATVTRHSSGERRGERRRSAFEVAARPAHAVGVDGRAGITERQVLTVHRRQDRLVVDAGIGHENAHALERGDGAALELGKAFLLIELPVGAKIDAARVGDRRHPHATLFRGQRGDALEVRDPRLPERLRVGHQMHLADFDEVHGIECPSDLDLLLDGGLARGAHVPGAHRLLDVVEAHAASFRPAARRDRRCPRV